MGVTYTRETWLAASAAWHEGEFEEDAWRAVRVAAAQRGMLYPPSGSRHDDTDAARPSQRAIVWLALDWTPGELLLVIGRSSTWSQVVDGLMSSVNSRRDELDEADLESLRRAEAERWADRRAAPKRLGDILRRAAGQ